MTPAPALMKSKWVRFHRRDADHLVALGAGHAKGDDAVDQREQRVILAHADVATRVHARAALTHDDRAGRDHLAAISLDAQHLRFGIAAVSRGAAAFLLCHD